MKIKANNLSEYFISLLALAGEVSKDIKISDATDKSVSNIITKLKKKHYLKIDKKHKRIRLKYPEGLEALKEFSEELYYHYMLVSNNHNFAMTEKGVKTSKELSEVIIFLESEGYEIDNLKIDYNPNNFGQNENEDILASILTGNMFDMGLAHFYENGEVVPLMEGISFIPETAKKFFSTRYIKMNVSGTNKMNLSKIRGILLSNENIYCIYSGDKTLSLNIGAEKYMKKLAYDIYQNAYDKQAKNISAIIFSNDIPKKFSDNMFNAYHVISYDHPEIFQMITQKNWKTKIQNLLYGDVSDTVYDGNWEGMPSYELLSCNYDKINIQHPADLIPHYICFSWQEETVRKLLKNKRYELQVLTNEQERYLLMNMLKN